MGINRDKGQSKSGILVVLRNYRAKYQIKS